MALAGRPTMKQELAELKVFRAKQSYFPQSIDSLVENWDKTLDRARNYTEPSKDGKPKDKPIIMKDLERMAREAGL